MKTLFRECRAKEGDESESDGPTGPPREQDGKIVRDPGSYQVSYLPLSALGKLCTLNLEESASDATDNALEFWVIVDEPDDIGLGVSECFPDPCEVDEASGIVPHDCLFVQLELVDCSCQ